MTETLQNIKDRFFRTLHGEISIEDFENWVYNSTELEKFLGPVDYTTFISLDYKKPKDRSVSQAEANSWE